MRTYTQEEKQAIIDRVISGEPSTSILTDTGIPKSIFYSWLRIYQSFFASLKHEELYRTKYRSEADFRSAVDKYIIFYNTKRPHRKLQYKTPEQKEEEYALKLAD